MRSAEEFADKRRDLWNGDVPFIRAVQADALRHAADEARKLNDGHDWPISRLLEAQAERLQKP